jgi:hypothetical protein
LGRKKKELQLLALKILQYKRQGVMMSDNVKCYVRLDDESRKYLCTSAELYQSVNNDGHRRVVQSNTKNDYERSCVISLELAKFIQEFCIDELVMKQSRVPVISLLQYL